MIIIMRRLKQLKAYLVDQGGQGLALDSDKNRNIPPGFFYSLLFSPNRLYFRLYTFCLSRSPFSHHKALANRLHRHDELLYHRGLNRALAKLHLSASDFACPSDSIFNLDASNFDQWQAVATSELPHEP